MLKEIAFAIRTRRLKLGISERSLSQNLKIEVQYLQALEQGLVDPDIHLLCALARELNWTPAMLVSRAESLSLAGKEVQRQVLHSIKTRRQLNTLEKQHGRLFSQLDRLKRQAEALEASRVLINESKPTLIPIKTNLKLVGQRLEGQRQSFEETMSRLRLIKQACDEHERFLQRSRDRRLTVVR